MYMGIVYMYIIFSKATHQKDFSIDNHEEMQTRNANIYCIRSPPLPKKKFQLWINPVYSCKHYWPEEIFILYIHV